MFSPCNADARFACIVGHRQTGHWNIVNCQTSDLLTLVSCYNRIYFKIKATASTYIKILIPFFFALPVSTFMIT